jgi:hypothetical protein
MPAVVLESSGGAAIVGGTQFDFRVRFLIPHFGEWPRFLPAFLVSCEENTKFEWYILTDLPKVEAPANVNFIHITLSDFLRLAEQRLGVPVNKTAYGLCDLRPALGVVCEEFLKGVDFWGHCDLDVIWGRLEIFLSEEHLRTYDVISSRPGYIAGHCSVYRNYPSVNYLFASLPGFFSDLARPENMHIDEIRMSSLLRKQRMVRVFWHRQYVADEEQLAFMPYGWERIEVCLFYRDQEYPYLHCFTLKKTLHYIDFPFNTRPSRFKITPRRFYAQIASVFSGCTHVLVETPLVLGARYKSLSHWQEN